VIFSHNSFAVVICSLLAVDFFFPFYIKKCLLQSHSQGFENPETEFNGPIHQFFLKGLFSHKVG
jgi:hypothetical protein